MRINRLLVSLFLVMATAAGVHAQSPEAIARLEAARTADPASVDALRSLGVAYYRSERFADASAVLEQARKLAPNDGVSALYAGLSAERVPDYTTARAAYDQYLGIKRPFYALSARRTAKKVRLRLLAIARDESIARAKAAVAAEAELSATPGNPRTIAVPAMKYSGPNAAELAPLERGLAELVITDLAKSSQLVLVERDRMQALADEIQLGASGRVDSASAVRAGQLIQAGRLVNGSIVQGGEALTLSTSIVIVPTAAISEPTDVTGGVDKFFDLQKSLVFRIFDQLAVTLTAEERAAIGEKQTKNFDSFLMYSRGLVAADAGRFEAAAELFNQSRALDPAFEAAATQASFAEAALAGSRITPPMLETSLPRAERGVVSKAVSGVVAPPAPPLAFLAAVPVLLSSIPSLPAVPPSPLGSTLTMTAQSVNPPLVSPLTNAAVGTPLPATPVINPSGNVFGLNIVIFLPDIGLILVPRR